MDIKVGSKQSVRKDLEIDKEYGNDVVVEEMLKYSGQEVTVRKIHNFEDGIRFEIWEDFGTWGWTPEMFLQV